MYAQVTVTAAYDPAALSKALIAHIGATSVAPLVALQGTSFASMAQAVAPTVVAAQSIRNAASILYFFDGPDTINVHITAATVAELKRQSRRVTRQMLPELKDGKKDVKAAILVAGSQGLDTVIMNGGRESLFRQLVSAAGEKWISKLLVPGIIFGLSSRYLGGTPSVASALIGFVAALLAFSVEVGLFVYHGDEWKWEEVP